MRQVVAAEKRALSEKFVTDPSQDLHGTRMPTGTMALGESMMKSTSKNYGMRYCHGIWRDFSFSMRNVGKISV